MAFDFIRTSSEAFHGSFSAVTGPPFTMSCWFEPDAASNLGHLMSLHDLSAVELHNLTIDLSATSTLEAGSFDGGWATATGSTTLVNGTTYHAAGTWASSTSREVFLDGVSDGTNTTSKNPTGIDDFSIGAQYFNNGAPSEEFDGRIAHPAIWNVVLTDEEIASLAAGASPLLIRPASLVLYVPLDRRGAIDLMGSVALSADGTPTFSEDLSDIVTMPNSGQVLQFAPVAPVAGGRIMSSLAAGGGLVGVGGIAGRSGGLAG